MKQSAALELNFSREDFNRITKLHDDLWSGRSAMTPSHMGDFIRLITTHRTKLDRIERFKSVRRLCIHS